MAYKVVENNKMFQVVEERKFDKSVEKVCLRSFPSREEAKLFMRKMNGGVGFNGWTPSFMLIPLPLKQV
jgi:hypothetical protein